MGYVVLPIALLSSLEVILAYQHHSKDIRIVACAFPAKSLRSLVDLAYAIHFDCAAQLIKDIELGKVRGEQFKDLDTAKVKELVDTSYLLQVEVLGMYGEYHSFLSKDELREASLLPQRFREIRINNQSFFKFTQSVDPSVYFNLSLDFENTRVFDLISQPTRSTENRSKLFVAGESISLVNGVTGTFSNFFREFRSIRRLVHAENMYDALLWLGFCPLLLVYLLKYQDRVPEQIRQSPAFVQVILGVVVFFSLTLAFRLVFNLGRWSYPYMEITDHSTQNHKIVKWIYSVSVAAVLGAIAVNFASFLVRSLSF